MPDIWKIKNSDARNSYEHAFGECYISIHLYQKDYSLPLHKGQGKTKKTLKSEKTEFRGGSVIPVHLGSLYSGFGGKDPE